MDNASPEYKELMSKTWLGQEEMYLSEDVDSYAYYMETLNLDYEKLEPRGNQLYLKVFFNNGKAFFMTVTPQRYIELRERGNIVVKLEYTKTAAGQFIITNITEVINK